MKIIRSCKIHFNHLTEEKRKELDRLRQEYTRIKSEFISKFEDQIPTEMKLKLLLKDNVHSIESWLTSRMKQDAFSEGYDLVHITKKSCAELKTSYHTPKPNTRMVLSSKIVSIDTNPKTKSFDLNVELNSTGTRKISIPLKKHRQFHKWASKGVLSKSVIIGSNYVQFSFKITTEEKKKVGNVLGIDIGANKLLACSNGQMYGDQLRILIDKLHRKKRGSLSYKRTKKEIREYIDLKIKKLPFKDLRLIVCENLKNIKRKMKLKRRLSKRIRRVISDWNYRYVLRRIQQLCEENRVSFRTVSPWNTSITCSVCGYADKGNRLSQELFCCLKCSHSENADINASKTTLNRFLTGKYGSCFQASGVDKCP